MIIGMEKSGKIHKNCNADLEDADVCSITMLITHGFVNFLQFMTQSVWSSEFRNWVPFGIYYRRIHCI